MNLTTLEQSKKLKELGAPQDTGRYWCSYKNATTRETIWMFGEVGHPISQTDWYGSDRAAAYDLESLIEWLGDDFDVMLRLNFNEGYQCGYLLDGCFEDRAQSGRTPLEAVCNLACAIKQPKE